MSSSRTWLPPGRDGISIPAALTVAGSDSGGGAGIQADLKTFAVLGVFGTSALTCVTAQNPDGVRDVEPLPPSCVRAQIDAVREAFPLAAVKTGMLYSAPIIEVVADALCELERLVLVVDPVMVATSGSRLLRDDALSALCDRLLPKATVVTPNLPEAEVLGGQPIDGREGLIAAAHRISVRFGIACVAKGGHLVEARTERSGVAESVIDVLVEKDGTEHIYETPVVAARQTHGTGCTSSAALAAGLALGRSLPEAVEQAQRYVAHALRNAVSVGPHAPLGWGSSG